VVIPAVAAVVFDLDGVLIDSEQTWDAARREVTGRRGGRWAADSTSTMLGMSTAEWSAYLTGELGADGPAEDLAEDVIGTVSRQWGGRPPLLPGAVESVRRVAARWPVGLASSSPRRLIDAFLDATGLLAVFGTTLSTEQVGRGKPAPDVYLSVAERLAVDPRRCVAVEDSSNGMRSAVAAGMRLIAVPNPHFTPAPDALAAAAVRITAVADLDQSVVIAAGSAPS
jgi:HAD superfamily hydrolase (TIGR01509 family)